MFFVNFCFNRVSKHNVKKMFSQQGDDSFFGCWCHVDNISENYTITFRAEAIHLGSGQFVLAQLHLPVIPCPTPSTAPSSNHI